ncbi:MAG: 50S ribosomal protein L15 [Spirochaetales bacterium]|jgi:large subunit ribosomal protein L15|nr:50S ribosomal protein L15 [Spirochaetales bacterium]
MENSQSFIIKPPKGAKKKRKIVGRGSGTRLQKTAGRGNKGQNSRAGGGVRPGFEGGQMPLYRRIARRGFSNEPFKIVNVPVNLGAIDAKYADGETVSLETLQEKRLIKKRDTDVKILSRGEITKKLSFKVEKLSAAAKEKIEKAGGSVITEKAQESKE